jgi:hypothetical protein
MKSVLTFTRHLLIAGLAGGLPVLHAATDPAESSYGPSTGRIPATYASLINANLGNQSEAAAYINWANGYFLNDGSPLPKCLAGSLRDQNGNSATAFYHSREGCPNLLYAYFQFYKRYPSDALGQDCLARCIAFANTVITNGTDRYGTVQSPLLSGILTREAVPRVPDNPLSPGTGLVIQLYNGIAGNNYYAMNIGNIWFGGDESHKSSWRGADPACDEYLYLLLYDMTTTLGDARYKLAADKSLSWFMTNCPSEMGLLPMGEHSGWDDFAENYERGYYHSRLHEYQGGENIYDKFIELQPRIRPGETNAMERYAFNMLAAHTGTATSGAGRTGMFLYCRHGCMWTNRLAAGTAENLDTFGGYPRHAGAWLRLWAQVYNRSLNTSFRSNIKSNINRLIDGLYEQRVALGVNYFPFANWTKNGTASGLSNSQNDKLAGGAREAAYLAQDDPVLRDRLLQVATDANYPGGMSSIPSYPGPQPASLPGPLDNATNVSQTPVLSWTTGVGTTRPHQVYFGTSLSALQTADTDSASYRGAQLTASFVPGTLAPSTTYYWAVDELSANGLTKGPIWSFTTGSSPPTPPPGPVTNPSPAQAVTDVSPLTQLAWSPATGATSYNLFFGTNIAPPFYAIVVGTNYDPGLLNGFTTHYWRVDAVNVGGTNTGTVWHFTTGAPLPAPSQASNPWPGNGATGVTNPVILMWTAGSNASSHDVYFGTVNPPPFQDNQLGAIFSPGPLASNTTYYWRIDEKNAGVTTIGTIWSFQTASASAAVLIDPPGGSEIDKSAIGSGGTHPAATGAVVNLTTFKNAHATAYAASLGGLENFDASSITANAAFDVAYGGGKLLRVTNAVHGGTISAFSGDRYPLSGGSQLATSDGLNHQFTFVLSDTNHLLKWLGIGLVGRTGRTSGDSTVTATLTLDDGQTVIASSGKLDNDTSDLAATNGTANKDVWFGFQAPAGRRIISLALLSDQAYFQPVDDLAFIVETVTPLPGLAGTPTPPNGAMNVPAPALLSWSAGPGTTSHRVYFGAVNPPPFQNEQTGTSFDAGSLAFNTPYYWRIDEVNISGTTTGAVWTFTTTVEPPGFSANPSPGDGATDVGPSGPLSWSAGDRTDSHDVYFGTNNPPLFVVNQPDISFDPGTLDFGTTYHWRVDEKNAGGTRTGTVWSFTVTLPVLTARNQEDSILLQWPTNATGFVLVSASNLTATVWTPVSLTPTVVNGFKTITNPITGGMCYFRLSRL